MYIHHIHTTYTPTTPNTPLNTSKHPLYIWYRYVKAPTVSGILQAVACSQGMFERGKASTDIFAEVSAKGRRTLRAFIAEQGHSLTKMDVDAIRALPIFEPYGDGGDGGEGGGGKGNGEGSRTGSIRGKSGKGGGMDVSVSVAFTALNSDMRLAPQEAQIDAALLSSTFLRCPLPR